MSIHTTVRAGVGSRWDPNGGNRRHTMHGHTTSRAGAGIRIDGNGAP